MPLKVGHHRHASETPLKWRFAGLSIIASMECWLGSFVILGDFVISRGRGGGGGSGPPVSILNPPMIFMES